MIQCPYCSSQLSTRGSYRVHKHRYHRLASSEATKPSSSLDNAVTKQRYPASNDNTYSKHTNASDNVIKQYQYSNASANTSRITDNNTMQASYPTTYHSTMPYMLDNIHPSTNVPVSYAPMSKAEKVAIKGVGLIVVGVLLYYIIKG